LHLLRIAEELQAGSRLCGSECYVPESSLGSGNRFSNDGTYFANALGDRIAFRLPFAARIPAVDARSHRVGEIDLDVALALPECDADPGQRAAGADRADKRVDRTLGLRPNLGTGRLVMTASVGEVVELIRKRARELISPLTYPAAARETGFYGKSELCVSARTAVQRFIPSAALLRSEAARSLMS